jgi:L-ascorbate metabolism protein UlaG (beta-lactamase superfamily)
MIRPLQQNDLLLADVEDASEDPGNLHLWWLGQSGFLFKQGSSLLLVDPYLSDSLTLKYAATDKPHVRMTERVVAPELLLGVKLVVSSHQHTDHFDEATLVPLARANNGLQLILPRSNIVAARQRLPGADISFVPCDEGQQLVVDGWSITGIAAAHNEVARDELGGCLFLGFIIQRAGFTIYHSGDTLWHPGLVPALLPFHCDVALVPINGNAPGRRVAGNLNGSEAAALSRAIGAKLAVPHHYQMFEFNTASPDEFEGACQRLGQPFKTLLGGERLTLDRNAWPLL